MTHIFHDLFDERSAVYQQILEALMIGSKSLDELLKDIGRTKSGTYAEYLNDLETAGFVSRIFSWEFSSGKSSRLRRYRISDPYVRFYLKYVEPRRNAIARSRDPLEVSNLVNWPTIAGLQLESLILENRERFLKLMGIRPEEIVQDGPFFQTKSLRRQGCQIDYLIQTKNKTLHVCEIKRSQTAISLSVRDEVQTKLSRLHIPRGFSVRTHLIYAGQLHEDLKYDDYFDSVISVEQFF